MMCCFCLHLFPRQPLCRAGAGGAYSRNTESYTGGDELRLLKIDIGENPDDVICAKVYGSMDIIAH